MQDYIAFAAAHIWLFAALVAVVAALIVSEIVGVSGGARRLNTNQTILAINRDAAQIVDIRTPNDYTSAHIAGAINIPEAQLTDKLNRLDKQKQIILVCAQGQRSLAATSLLRQKGYTELAILEGGMNTWRRDGLPTISS